MALIFHGAKPPDPTRVRPKHKWSPSRHVMWGRALPKHMSMIEYGYYGTARNRMVYYLWYVKEDLPDKEYVTLGKTLRVANRRYHQQFTVFDRVSSPDEELDTLLALSALDFKHE